MIIDIKNDKDVALLRKATEGRVVGLTSGCYDLFHHLHLVYLQRCSGLCDVLIVGVDSNDLIASFKGPDRPLIPEHQRIAIISALHCVDSAFVMRSVEDFGTAVKRLNVTKIFKNQGEFYGKPVEGAEDAEVVIIPDISNHSSTSQIIDDIAKNFRKEVPTPPPVGVNDKRNTPV